jgi:hypothetical protein
MRTWRTFPLRILKASWGIAVDLRARAILSKEPRSDLLNASSRVLLDVRHVQLPVIDVEQLLRGLTTMAAAIETKEPSDYVVIEVDEVTYTPTDYQPEGLAAAMIGWVSEEFDLDSPIRDVHFDQGVNKYVFSI